MFEEYIPIINLIVGIIGGGVGTWVLGFYREKKVQDLAANDQAIRTYKEMFDAMKERLIKIESAFDSLEKEYLMAREENMQMHATLKHLPCQKQPSECKTL